MKKRGQGREKLIQAAHFEFEELGYDGTNTNAIAKRAGYAPQTFYRHFLDKKAIFLAVYQDWAVAEIHDILGAQTLEAAVDAILAHHKTHAVFRRSLRMLTVSDPEIGQARAVSRQAQIAALEFHFRHSNQGQSLATIFQIERLCDALVDGEFLACGIDDDSARQAIVDAVRELVSKT